MIFSKNTSNPADQAVAKGKPVDNGTLGPNAAAKYDPKAFMNVWASKLYSDQPDAKKFSDQSFSADDAAGFRNKVIGAVDAPSPDKPFEDQANQKLGIDFLAKYLGSSLLGEEEKINRSTLDPLIRQQPSEGVAGNEIASRKMNYPGTNSTQVG